MPRPIWKGSLSFGLVSIPVGLYSAVDRQRELSFHLLHKQDQSRVEYRRVCAEEGVEVPWSEIVKGYEYDKGQYVVMTDEDFQKARVPASETIEITDFVPADAIDFMFFDQPYYVAPGGKGGTKAYALLRDALAETGRVGIGMLVMRQRQHLVAVEPAAELLSVTTMRWAEEIRPAREFDVPARGEGYAKKEMSLAQQLIDTLASEWDPSKYSDTYTEVLRHAIEQKVETGTIEVPAAPEKRPRVVNLVKALEESLKTPRKGPARAEGRDTRQPATGRRRTTRRPAA
jgi:DNA end-binding protein Ku